jgi:predicted RNase H-like HicB family nuclease
MRQTKLQAGLDRDEAIAKKAQGVEHAHGDEPEACESERCAHDRNIEPSRALKIFAALRKVLDEHREKNGYCDTCRHYDYAYSYDPVPYPCPTVQALESIYTDDPEPRYYTVHVTWSEEDSEHVGTCPAFPSLSYLAPGYFDALQGIHQLVQNVIADMNSRGEPLPEEK